MTYLPCEVAGHSRQSVWNAHTSDLRQCPSLSQPPGGRGAAVLLQYVCQCPTIGQLCDHPHVFWCLIPLMEHKNIGVVQTLHQTNLKSAVKKQLVRVDFYLVGGHL